MIFRLLFLVLFCARVAACPDAVRGPLLLLSDCARVATCPNAVRGPFGQLLLLSDCATTTPFKFPRFDLPYRCPDGSRAGTQDQCPEIERTRAELEKPFCGVLKISEKEAIKL